MKKFKLVESVTKEVVASLNVEDYDFTGIKENINIINSWVRDMSENNVYFTLKNPKHMMFKSQSPDWKAYFQGDEILVEHTTHSVEIVPDDDTDIFKELKEKVFNGEL